MRALHIFVGPSCPEPLLLRQRPNAVLHGPVKHGDLFSPDIGSGDTVILIDGSYHHRLALRHKEILDALERGVGILGAASIGALRAAELIGTGMVGVGLVYQWFREGVFEGDDAVAVAHAETDSPTGVNIPLVNLYAGVLVAQGEGVLDAAAVRRLMAVWEAEYYPLRTRERALALAAHCGEQEFVDWCRVHWDVGSSLFDQKRADTLAALDVAEGYRGEPRRNGRAWQTEFHRRWRSRFTVDGMQPPPHQRLAYQQLFNSEFPAVWWEFLHLALEPRDFRAHVRDTLGATAEGWLANPLLRDRIAALVRPLPDLGDAQHRALLLAKETTEDRRTAETWLSATRKHLDENPGRSLTQISDAACMRLLSQIWGLAVDDLDVECGRRGLLSRRQAAVMLRPFVIGYLTAPAMTRGQVNA